MTLPPASADRALRIYLALAQYPILMTRIRARMRKELFERGVINQQDFEIEVHEQAIRSQAREGLDNPYLEESAEVWETRLARIRSHLTDFYFAYNLPYELFEQIVREVLSERVKHADDLLVSFNPELAPQSMLFEHAQAIEQLPPVERERAEARLREIKVVLIRTMISDQLAYINIAKEWFNVSDLMEIKKRRIGGGKIGGKAAGMLLALRILSTVADEATLKSICIPESYFIGSDGMYSFMALNNLLHWSDQKYKSEEQIRSDYPQICKDYLASDFPNDLLGELRNLLDTVGKQPLIVRSSSLLEDNFGTSFAGKYESIFCPNQDTPKKNLAALTKAIAQVYASVLNPDALLYRRSKGLQDYDERMAILIQVVKGEKYGRYYLPHASGVAFSRNLYRWSPIIRREDGFLRLVWGLGTRAVEQVGNEFPRLVALSHPLLRPDPSPTAVRRYSQQCVDLIDLQDNAYKTLPVTEVLDSHYLVLRYLAQIDRGGYLAPLRSMLVVDKPEQLVLTFDELLRRTPLASRLRKILKLLETHYHSPVDTEFTARIPDPGALNPEVEICLLQCRPLSRLKESEARLPDNIPAQDILLSTYGVVPQGRVENIQYILYVDPECYFRLPTAQARSDMGRAIGNLNKILHDRTYICIGPGRWGTRNPDLGVFIGYADIYNTRALIELSGRWIGVAPEPSFGTHFFQDLVEANIFPLAINLDAPEAIFQRALLSGAPNVISQFIPEEANRFDCLRLIDAKNLRPGAALNLVMDDERGRAAAFFVSETSPGE